MSRNNKIGSNIRPAHHHAIQENIQARNDTKLDIITNITVISGSSID